MLDQICGDKFTDRPIESVIAKDCSQAVRPARITFRLSTQHGTRGYRLPQGRPMPGRVCLPANPVRHIATVLFRAFVLACDLSMSRASRGYGTFTRHPHLAV